MAIKNYIPIPVFDTLSETKALHQLIYTDDDSKPYIKNWLLQCFARTKISLPSFAVKDYQVALNFLYSYRGSAQTYGAYRRELERLLQWSWFVREKAMLKLKRDDIEAFIEFCIKPYKRWIGTKTVARFKLKGGHKQPNKPWRPFDVSLSKKDIKAGKISNKADYQFSQAGLKALFAILSSFYNYCLQEEVTQVNPLALIRQKSKFIRKESTQPAIRRLSNKQWQTVVKVAKAMAIKDNVHERTVFILVCLYAMYLRISELTAHERWTPTMGDFFKDN